MSRLFISHSSASNAAATALRDWLRDNGWDDVFLDTDPERGIAAGERWERKLNEAASRCEAVIFVISKAWLASPWCGKEFNLARRLNKRLFGVLVEDVLVAALPEPLTGAWQVVNLAAGEDHEMFRVIIPITQEEAHVTFSRDGLKRLRAGLKKAGLDPLFFDWPPKTDPERSPYPGLKPLEAADAGIFFGRDAPVIEALDSLRGLREAAAPRIAVILGASGSGKSSFLRAGLLPRLARDDRNFLPLPIIRPQRGAISGETGLISTLESALAAREMPESRAAIRAAVQGGAATLRPLLTRMVERLFRQTLAEEGSAAQPSVILAIDQAEELFSEDGRAEGAVLLDLVRQMVTADEPAIIVLFAIRSDSCDRLQTAGSLEGLKQNALPLLPMPRGNYQTVIEEPARRLSEAGRVLTIDPRLTETLLADIEKGGGSDALPLLAFTLEQLYAEFGRGSGRIRLADYQDFGGVGGAIEAAVARALAAANCDPRIPAAHEARLALLRRGLIPWLAGIDPETGSPRRRVARLADVPAESLPLIELLITQRLLATDRIAVRDGETVRYETTVEPAHEALLRQWGLLRGWLQEDFAALTTLEAVKTAARDWAANDFALDWLNHSGGRLEDAETIAARPDLASDLSTDARNYLRRCWERDEETRKEREAALLREEKRLAEIAAAQARTSRLQRNFFVSIGAAMLAIVLIGGAVFWEHARLQISEANLGKSEATLDASQIAVAYGQTNVLANLALSSEGFHRIDDAFRFALLAATLREALPKSGPLQSYPGATLANIAMTSPLEHVLVGHEAAVTSASFSSDGTRIITASQDNTARIWNVENGQPIAILKGHTDSVLSAWFSPDGTKVVTSSIDGTARVWDAATGRQLFVIREELYSAPRPSYKPISIEVMQTGAAYSAVFSPNGAYIATAFGTGKAQVWDSQTGRLVASLVGHTRMVYSVVFSPDSSQIVTASADGSARLWDAKTGEQLSVLVGSEASFSPDGTRILTASNDDTARVWDARTGRQLLVFSGQDTGEFSPDGKLILTVSLAGTAIIWDAQNGHEVKTISTPTGSITLASFSHDGSMVVTVSSDYAARVWSVGRGALLTTMEGHTGHVRAASFNPSGTSVVTASDDGTARIWEVFPRLKVTEIHKQDISLWGTFSPDLTRVVVPQSRQNYVRIWNVETGQPTESLVGHSDWVTNAAFSSDGSLLVTSSQDATSRIWDVRTGRQLTTFNGNTYLVTSAAFSIDKKHVVNTSEDFTVRIWDAMNGHQVSVIENSNSADIFEAAAFSPDGSCIVTASQDGTARVWNVATARQEVVLPVRPSNLTVDIVRMASFSPDGKKIVTASDDGVGRVWDSRSGQLLAELRGHSGGLISAEFSPDGSRIVTNSLDNTLRIWDTLTGQQIAVLPDAESQGTVSFSQDGTHVASISINNIIQIWDVSFATMPTKGLISYVCLHQLLGISTLTRAEMNLAGYPDSTPLIDACAGIK